MASELAKERPRAALVISDVHLTDREGGNPISPGQWDAFMRDEVQRRAQREPLELVLLGDIVDVLRSDAWTGQPRPWSQVGQRFEAFPHCAQVGVLLGILERIHDRYQAGFERLRQLVTNGRVVTHYILGNHDFTVSLAPVLLDRVAMMFALKGAATELPEVYRHPDLRLVGRHGHQNDPLNMYDRHGSRWALGDAIVVCLVNGLSRRYMQNTQQGPGHPVVRALDQLDNVPHAQIAKYLREILETCIPTNDHAPVENAWAGAVDELLEVIEAERSLWSVPRLPEFMELLPKLRWIRSPEAFSAAAALSDRWWDLRQPSDFRAAHTMINTSDQPRFVVMGHTHKPGVSPLRMMDGPKRTVAYYLNTGSWRTVWEPVAGDPRQGFAPRQVEVFASFELRAGDEIPRFEHVVRCLEI